MFLKTTMDIYYSFTSIFCYANFSLSYFKSFKPINEMTLGFIILGSCPGTASNVITYLCNGNVPLSLMCTLTSTILSILITPYLILFFADKSINIDLISLVYSTSKIVLIPLVLGLLVRIYFLNLLSKYSFYFQLSQNLLLR